MSNRSIAIMVLILVAATGYLLVTGDGDIDMGGEKHGAEAVHVEDKDKKPAAAPTAPTAPAAPAAEPAKK
jgi:hypothetical protein